MPTTRGDQALCIGCGAAIMERDATDMATALQALGHTDVDLMTGRDVTQGNMRGKIASLLENAPIDRTAILFCSCHASYDPDGTLWLLPYEALTTQSHSLGLSVSELRLACLDSAANVLVILDCCYAGAIATDNLGKLSRKWRNGPGRIFLTSSNEHDATFCSHRSRNSALTAVVLKNLSCSKGVRDLAQRIKSYFSERPHWGPSVCAEERGSDFYVCSTACEFNEQQTRATKPVERPHSSLKKKDH